MYLMRQQYAIQMKFRPIFSLENKREIAMIRIAIMFMGRNAI